MHQTIDSTEVAVKAIDALLVAIKSNPGAGATAAYKAALARHGRQIVDTVGPEALAAVLSRITEATPDRAEAREAILDLAWSDLPGWCS